MLKGANCARAASRLGVLAGALTFCLGWSISATAESGAPLAIEIDATFGDFSERGADSPGARAEMTGNFFARGAVTATGLLPFGAHMVSYGGEHLEGPWHGGGWIPDTGSPSETFHVQLVSQLASPTSGTARGTWTIGANAGDAFEGIRAQGDATCEFELVPGRNRLHCTLTGTGHFPPGDAT